MLMSSEQKVSMLISLTTKRRLNHMLDFSRTAEMMFSVWRGMGDPTPPPHMYLFVDPKKGALSAKNNIAFF